MRQVELVASEGEPPPGSGTTLARRVLACLVVGALVMSTVACSAADDQVGCFDDDRSVARIWNEVALNAIRRDFPAPTVHARNLYHLSVAMWDAWVIYDDGPGVAHTTTIDAPTSAEEGDQRAAIAFAAHRVLSSRYANAIGGEESLAEIDATLEAMCLNTEMANDPSSGAAVGSAIADEVLSGALEDGAREDNRYVADFDVANEPLVLAEPGTTMEDPNRWQQLLFVEAQTQNGLLLESNLQDYVGPHWGYVTPFALDKADDGLPIDPGPPPLLGTSTDDAFRQAVVDVIRASSLLDPAAADTIDLSPSARGNNPLGTNDGAGYERNPATGEPYAPNPVNAADYYRVIAEFWADGPDSETPPGHWNTLANEVSDSLDDYRLTGSGDSIDRLQWDVSLYFALNGALHDAAIAAWGTKAVYDYARPISMIRYLGGNGDLPEVPGLIEVVTTESSQPGERHEHLADSVGETAVMAWARRPVWFADQTDQVRWILAVDWKPYQRSTFVTPAFPGYVSGHSTFSRAAAEVLTAITGSAYFPDGLGTYEMPEGELEFDGGPSTDVELQWATYYDAADEAGLSRIYGGIHVEADDLAGRIVGSAVGLRAWDVAHVYIGG